MQGEPWRTFDLGHNRGSQCKVKEKWGNYKPQNELAFLFQES